MSDFKVNIDPRAVSFEVSMRPREGAVAQEGGLYAPADTEVAVTVCVGVTKESSVLDAVGKRHGRMVPIATFARPLADFIVDAKIRLGAQDAAEDQAAAKELRQGLSLV